MSLRILHLSDTHLLAERARHYGKIDTSGLLEAAVAGAGELAPCHAIVVSGDISDDGTPRVLYLRGPHPCPARATVGCTGDLGLRES